MPHNTLLESQGNAYVLFDNTYNCYLNNDEVLCTYPVSRAILYTQDPISTVFASSSFTGGMVRLFEYRRKYSFLTDADIHVCNFTEQGECRYEE